MKLGVYVFDLDGTLALRGDRDPFDMTRVGEDLPNEPVVTTCKALRYAGFVTIFFSGRDESAMLQTTMWLKHHVLDPDRGPLWMLLMRKIGDNRPDDVIKQELLDTITSRYNIIAAFDDRDKVVQMWRNNNIACFQVAPGDF